MKRLMLLMTLCCLAAQVNAAEWLTDLPKALERAKAEKKCVLMDFTGSDWCPECIQLRKKVFTSQAFEDYAKANLVLVVVDFPDKVVQPEQLKRANKALADKYGVAGYPTIIVLDGNGKQLMKDIDAPGKTPQQFIAGLEKWSQKKT